MSNSLKMARLDYFTFKSQITVYAAFVFMIIMFSVMGSSFITLTITAAWFTALLATNIFAIQEKNELERLYASLSLGLKNIIRGRYIFVFINYISALSLSILIRIAASLLQNGTVDYAGIILSICISLLAFTSIIGILMPIHFKLGYTNARAWSMIPFVLVMAVCMLPSFIEAFSSMAAELMRHRMILEMICLIISFVTFTVSYHLSVMCYQKRR